MGYQPRIQLISDGELVRAGTDNRPLGQLASNLAYLKEIIDASSIGEAIIARDKTIDPSVQAGQPVYYNAAAQRYEAAQAAITTAVDGALETAASALVWGLVLQKTSLDRADILLHGLSEIDLSNAVDGQVGPGMLYLSPSSPGKLTSQRPAVSVPVCLVGGSGASPNTYEVYVNPSFREFLDAHQHYRVELVCRPAGIANTPAPGQQHAIIVPNASLEGWLPASHETFSGKAPPGAKFGYNIGVNPLLSKLWPPSPPENAYLEWHRGGNTSILGMGVPSGNGWPSLVQFDEHGIWWFSDCYGDAPWAEPLELSLSLSCPFETDMRMVLWFTRPVFWTANTAVLSLEAAEGSGLSVKCRADGQPASTGHLLLDFDLGLSPGQTDAPGYIALKGVQDNSFVAGPVVEGIKSGSPNVSLSGSAGAPSTDGSVKGIVTISVSTDIAGTSLPVQTVRLDGVTEEFYAETIALGFPPSIASEYRGRIYVSSKAALPSGTRMKLRFRLMGRASGSIPANILSLRYRRIPAPAALNSPLDLPLADTALSLNCAATLTAANQYYDVESSAFDISAGDVVLFTLSRGASDGYNAELHVLEESGVLV